MARLERPSCPRLVMQRWLRSVPSWRATWKPRRPGLWHIWRGLWHVGSNVERFTCIACEWSTLRLVFRWDSGANVERFMCMCSGGVLARMWRGSRASRVSGVRHGLCSGEVLARMCNLAPFVIRWGSGTNVERFLHTRCEWPT